MISLGRSNVRSSRASSAGLVSSLVVLPGLFGVACSEGDLDPNTVTAGTTSTGGTQTGNAGSSGSPGVGGTTSNGGSTSGGSGGAGPSGPTETLSFATGLEGFRVNYQCVGPGMNVGCAAVLDPVAPGAGDAGGDAAADAGEEPPAGPTNTDLVTQSHDLAVGDPEAGSAKLEIAFSASGQLINYALNIDTLNLTGKTITARMLVDAGAPPTTYGKLYIKTGMSYSYADSGQITPTPGAWSTLTFVASAMPNYVADPALHDVADTREIGIEIGMGMTETTFVPAVVHIDTVSY